MAWENELRKLARFEAIPLSILCQGKRCVCKELEEQELPGWLKNVGRAMTVIGLVVVLASFIVMFLFIGKTSNIQEQIMMLIPIVFMVSILLFMSGSFMTFFKAFKYPWKKKYLDYMEVYADSYEKSFLFKLGKSDGKETYNIPITIKRKGGNIVEEYIRSRKIKRIESMLALGATKAWLSPDAVPNPWRMIIKKCGDYYLLMVHNIENLFGKNEKEAAISPFLLMTICITKEDAIRLMEYVKKIEGNIVLEIDGSLKRYM